MEKSQLDFKAPLLSARRFASPRNSSSKTQLVNKSENTTKLLAASIPFNWEHTPGRPKHDTGEIPRRYLSGDTFIDNERLLQNLNDNISSIDESDSFETESQQDTTVPLNSLSLPETWSGSKPNHSGKFCVDKQTREFMMSRFLPAAKAATLEAQQKKLVSMEIKKKPLIMKDNESDGLQLPYFDDEDDKESIAVLKKSGRCSWGINNIPRIYVNLKNPLLSIKLKSKSPKPSKGGEIRFRRNADSGPQVPPKKKFYSGLLSLDLNKVKDNRKRSSKESYHQLLSSPNRPGQSPMRRYGSGSMSPYSNKSPKSTYPSMQDVSRTNQVKEKVPSGSKHDDANDVRMYRNRDHDKESRDVRLHKEGVKLGIKRGDNNRFGEWDDLPLKMPLPPPPPKSPMESWLWSTLPSVPHSDWDSPIHS